jgi:hypothetical protein
MARRRDLRDLGRRARRLVEERFDPRRQMEALAAVYGRVAA